MRGTPWAPTHTEGVHAHKQGIMRSVCPCVRASKTLKRRHCFPSGVNSRRRQIAMFNKQSICTKHPTLKKKQQQKKPLKISPFTMELINISAAQPWLFMQAMRGLMRQSCKDNVLATVEYLLKDKIIFQIRRISRALPRVSGSWREPLETFRWMKACEWACLSVRAQMWFRLICCVKDLICCLLSAHFEPHLMRGRGGVQINDAWWTDTKTESLDLWGFNQRLSKPQIDFWMAHWIFRGTKHSCRCCDEGTVQKWWWAQIEGLRNFCILNSYFISI